MTTYVQYSEEDPAFDLFRLVIEICGGSVPASREDKRLAREKGAGAEGPGAKNLQEVLKEIQEEEIKDGNYIGLFHKCFACKQQILEAEEKQISATFDLLLSVLQLVRPEYTPELITNMTTMLVEDERHSALKIQLLTSLFNLTSDKSECRSSVFRHILTYALRTENESLLVGKLGNVEKWVKIWNLGYHETRELYLLCTKIMKKKDSIGAQKFRLLYLNLFEQDSKDIDEAVAESCEAIISAVKDKNRMDDMLEIPAIANLRSRKPGFYQLLQIFASGLYTDFHSFCEKNPTFLKAVGLDVDFCSEKIRSLTICTLSNNNSPVLPYDTLSKHLLVESDLGIESCIVAAVRTGLIEAKINQEQRTVTILRSMERLFRDESWRDLQQQLYEWKENTRNVLLLLHQVRQQRRGGQ